MEARTQGSAFGLSLDVAFPCPGLPPRAGIGPTVTLDLIASDATPDRHGGESLFDAGGVSLVRAVNGDHVFEAPDHGRFVIAADGTHVGCAPAPAAPWAWQRFLVGQVLPFVAVLNGFEVFHASVVRLGERVVAFTGASRRGKSTLATALVLAGGRLITDDVMAVDQADDGSLRVHAGFGIASVRHEAAHWFGSEALAALGETIGVDDDAARVLVDVEVGPHAITELFFLDRAAEPGEPIVQTMHDVDPRLLLAAGYNYLVRTPERLVRHLDVCAQLARTATLGRIAIAPERGPLDVVAALTATAGRASC